MQFTSRFETKDSKSNMLIGIKQSNEENKLRKLRLEATVRRLEEEKRWLAKGKMSKPAIEIRQLKNEKDMVQGTIQLITEVLTEAELEKREQQGVNHIQL